MQEEDDKLQKKTYRVIEQICHSHAIWVITNKEALDLIRSGTLTAQASATKKVCVPVTVVFFFLKYPSPIQSRLLCIAGLIKGIPESAAISEFIGMVIGEVLMCTKEPNSKTRAAAFDLLVAMANRMSVPATPQTRLTTSLKQEQESTTSVSPATTPLNVTPFLLTVVAGLAGTSTHMMSATLAALARLIFEFKGRIPKYHINLLIAGDLVFPHRSSRSRLR